MVLLPIPVNRQKKRADNGSLKNMLKWEFLEFNNMAPTRL